jgi:hypothetical protein
MVLMASTGVQVADSAGIEGSRMAKNGKTMNRKTRRSMRMIISSKYALA